MKQELQFIISQGFTEDNADSQIDAIETLFEENDVKLEGKTYGAIWDFAKNYLKTLK